MVKYLSKKGGEKLSEENKMEMEHLKKLIKKYEKMEKSSNLDSNNYNNSEKKIVFWI